MLANVISQFELIFLLRLLRLNEPFTLEAPSLLSTELTPVCDFKGVKLSLEYKWWLSATGTAADPSRG